MDVKWKDGGVYAALITDHDLAANKVRVDCWSDISWQTLVDTEWIAVTSRRLGPAGTLVSESEGVSESESEDASDSEAPSDSDHEGASGFDLSESD